MNASPRKLYRYIDILARHNEFLAEVLTQSMHKDDSNVIKALVEFEQTVDHVRCVLGVRATTTPPDEQQRFTEIVEGRRRDMELEFVTMIRYRSLAPDYIIRVIEQRTRDMAWYINQ